ncbi:class I SAM-dependent methyltransferase [Fontimonas sp. SYSU GA230001]|uniref:class I SAM-dependent methyltransferase n=1 Tax=Fontimonas sp. SYSU GA230001 TaxID=3142450 RepID=UPI0032B4B44C
MSDKPASERISPTAYATGQMWVRHGLSHPAFVTPQGERLDRAFGLLTRLTQRLSGVSLDAMMLARHKGIDAVLAQAIDAGQVAQVIEIAAGLSARGWRMRQRYGDRITYIETDLPAMAATKRTLLERAGFLGERHRVLELDALADKGSRSLAAVSRTLDPERGTAIITEGLMNYLDPGTARAVWRRIARVLKQFPNGLYLTDAYFVSDNRNVGMLAFGAILQVFVRGRMHVHFADAGDACAKMAQAGFREAQVYRTQDLDATREIARTKGGDRVCVLAART